MTMNVGDVINGNKITAIWGTVYIFDCGKCGNEFTRTKNKVQFYPPKSCGCAIRKQHERMMAMAFRTHRKDTQT